MAANSNIKKRRIHLKKLSLTSVVVIPAFNAERLIGETLNALQANLSLDRLSKVILLNDCSTDDTKRVAIDCWQSDVPFEVLDNHTNLGERRTINNAIERLASDFDWTFILHADDVVKPNWLSLYFEAIEQIPKNVISVCSSYDSWWPSSGRIEKGDEFLDRSPVYVLGNYESVRSTIDRGCWWHISGCAIKNTSFIEVGGFKADMPQLGDWEWLLRSLAKGYGILYLPRSTMLYRQHEGSVSFNSIHKARDLEERWLILRIMHDQGYLSLGVYQQKIRRLLIQLGRRTIVRALRVDYSSFLYHLHLLRRMTFAYVLLTI